jgi:hypothetical protein
MFEGLIGQRACTVLYQQELTYASYIEQGLGREAAREKTDDFFVRGKK